LIRAAHVAATLLAGAAWMPARGQDGADAAPVVRPVGADAARTAIRRGLDWLVAAQNPDGSWAHGTQDSLLEDVFALESYYAWQMAADALACTALLACEETPERRAVLDRGLERLCAARLPGRGETWDIDYVWAMACGLPACVAAARDPRYRDEPWRTRIERRGREFCALLAKRQTVDGGWGYYDSEPFPRTSLWATSFTTASVIPALIEARDLGWAVDPALIERAVRYVERCALPNGAYAYDLRPIPSFAGESINAVPGSLGRIQVCNWALAKAGVARITPDRVREGLEAFFRDHAFLDVARMKPIPHEAYYRNAGYFYFFGHVYAARAIELLPAAEREAWHARLRAQVIKAQQADGSSLDFQGGAYLRVADTAFSILALQAGLAP
jgi:Prenyltransferase and squalene oxidase repeat